MKCVFLSFFLSRIESEKESMGRLKNLDQLANKPFILKVLDHLFNFWMRGFIQGSLYSEFYLLIGTTIHYVRVKIVSDIIYFHLYRLQSQHIKPYTSSPTNTSGV